MRHIAKANGKLSISLPFFCFFDARCPAFGCRIVLLQIGPIGMQSRFAQARSLPYAQKGRPKVPVPHQPGRMNMCYIKAQRLTADPPTRRTDGRGLTAPAYSRAQLYTRSLHLRSRLIPFSTSEPVRPLFRKFQVRRSNSIRALPPHRAARSAGTGTPYFSLSVS